LHEKRLPCDRQKKEEVPESDSYSKQNIPLNDYYWYNSLYTAIPDTPIVRVLLGYNEE